MVNLVITCWIKNTTNFFLDFVKEIYTNWLQLCINEAARFISKQESSLIDKFFVNILNKELNSGNFLKKISDNSPNFVIFKKVSTKILNFNIKKETWDILIKKFFWTSNGIGTPTFSKMSRCRQNVQGLL